MTAFLWIAWSVGMVVILGMGILAVNAFRIWLDERFPND